MLLYNCVKHFAHIVSGTWQLIQKKKEKKRKEKKRKERKQISVVVERMVLI
jgi:putative Ca2+/H+ antiporter (TMEM165/GDT1 family)